MEHDARHPFTRYMEERRNEMVSIAIPEASSGEFALVPEATYLMTLKDMQPAEQDESSPYYDPDKPRVRWIFVVKQVLDGEPLLDKNGDVVADPEDFVGTEFHGYTSLNMHKRATMRAWVQGLLGREIVDGEKVESSDLIGKSGRCNVVHYEKQSGNTGHKIESIRPYRRGSQPKPAPVVEEPAEDEDDETLF